MERKEGKSLFGRMGPAWIISAVACGPATLASVSVAGASFGYQLLWVVVLSAVLAFVAQYLAAKLGLLTGRGVISAVDDQLGRAWGWILMIDALLATWLASTVLMKALVDTSAMITGLSGGWWALFWAVALFLLVGVGGYKLLEWVCKVMVGLVVVCFVITVFIVRPELGSVLTGLWPTVPGGVDSALMMAGIMGGAVHVTIIAMHSYNVNSRGWGRGELKLARQDTLVSMLIAFGMYSVAIYLAAAATLHPNGIKVRGALDVAQALQPFLGPYAGAVLLAGLWGAVISTISPTFLAAGYFLSDKMGWGLSVKDNRFRMAVAAGCLLSLIAPLLKGSFIYLLVTMLALGLAGTPLVLVMLLILLNRRSVAGDKVNRWPLNLMGGLAALVTAVLAVRFIAVKLGLWG